MCDMLDMKPETTIIKYIFYFILNGKYTQFNLLLVCMVFVSGRRAVVWPATLQELCVCIPYTNIHFIIAHSTHNAHISCIYIPY